MCTNSIYLELTIVTPSSETWARSWKHHVISKISPIQNRSCDGKRHETGTFTDELFIFCNLAML